MTPWRLVAGCTLLITMLGCQRPGAGEVVVYTSVDQVFSNPIFRAFEAQSGTRVRAVFDTEEAKSTGVLNRLIAEAAQPQADVFWSGDPVRPFVLVKRGLVERYVSPSARDVPAQYKAADGTWTGFAARARVLLVNTEALRGRDAPRSIRDLADPRWAGAGAIANPVFGTTTIHAAALFARWGDAETRAFFEAMRQNRVRIASSNGEVKRLVGGGEVTFGLTDTDDAHEAVESGAPVAVVYPDQSDGGTLVLPTAVVLMKDAPHADAGRRLIDFLLSPNVERRLAESGAHMPLRPGVPVPKGVIPVSNVKAMAIDYGALGEAMERAQPWLRAWAGM